MTLFRFIVSDEDGPLRRFPSKQEALEFIGDNDWTLTTIPREKKKKVDMSKYEDAPF